MSAATLDLEDVVGAATLVDIVADLAESLFPGEPRPVAVPHRDPQEPVGARIRITGGWDGVVVLRMSWTFAEQLAHRLFLLPDGTAVDADLLDVLGEVVNIVGGNVKALLPGDNQLSLPHPRLADVVPPAGGLHATVLWGVEPVQISITPDPAPEAHHHPVEGPHR
ncbi:chemotaxis protein CheX [Lapillicoccus jejuensis]|uniref:Chemotaxis protein CheX n=1 Tax=Lapillicoccus jejuensis TaxID=402171 RepID=A0A542E1G8_9MICO|nr:chemotaxis protein CheX [Lapillicoccus jejuensis]TQJ09119.1 chemotaxis protein CheX [Lapillicoccus jejuensis]